MKRLSGRTAIITGAADGIGRAVARGFAREGANILVADINAESGQGVAGALRDEFAVGAEFLATDVRDKAQVIAMVDRAVALFGGVDILVNNAWGGGTFRRAENKSDSELQHGLDMNVWACFWAMQAAFPHLKASGRGRIINLCSINGVNAYTGTLEYNLSKEALRAMTRSLAREWASHQICANVICPAAMTVALVKLLEQSPELATGAQVPPMGRIGDPDRDIAGVAIFLASDEACFVTGNTLFVDGGTHINGGGWNVPLPE